jgi:hypothetical protein
MPSFTPAARRDISKYVCPFYWRFFLPFPPGVDSFFRMADDDGTAFNAFRIRLISSSTASTIKIQKDTDKASRYALSAHFQRTFSIFTFTFTFTFTFHQSLFAGPLVDDCIRQGQVPRH